MDIGKKSGLTYGASTRNAFGEALKELGYENPNLIVLDADVGNSTRTEYFGEVFPDRFLNVGIAESNLVGVASGISFSGKDVVAASFAAFLFCNAYDQIRMNIAFPNANVKLVGSHSGISIGEDGPSQMAIEDIALSSALPNFTVIVPADAISTKALTRLMFKINGPVYLRTGRPKVPLIYKNDDDFKIGKAKQIRDGSDATIIACGLMVSAALDAAEDLQRGGIEVRILDMHTLKPLDEDAIIKAAKETGAIVCAEEHVLQGGLGMNVALTVGAHYPIPMDFVGIQDQFAESGKSQELLEKYHLMPADIEQAVRSVVKRK